VTKMLLICGVVAGPLFVAVFLIEGATRANYNPLRHPISSLALSGRGWVQIANFIASALLTIAFAIGLHRTLPPLGGSIWEALFVGMWGVGLLGAGIFITNPVSGYPPGAPGVPTRAGILHDLFSLLGFVGLVLACFVFAGYFARQGNSAWAAYSVVSAVVFVVALVLASEGFAQAARWVNIAGFIQRIQVVAAWSWISLLAVHFLAALPETR
jgi:hypothetical protein